MAELSLPLRLSRGLPWSVVARVPGSLSVTPLIFALIATVGIVPALMSWAAESVHMVPFFPSASDDLGRQGFVRVMNHSDEPGEVKIMAIDDEGAAYGPATLAIEAGATVHFNSGDLEDGNVGKALTGNTGAGQGDWRLALGSDLHIEVLSYLRTSDGTLASMHDTVPWREGAYRVAAFNPGSNKEQQSLIRVANIGEATATVSIEGIDDAGDAGVGTVTVEIPAGAARTYSAAALESASATGLTGSLGDGAGKWQLDVRSDQALVVMNLLSNPAGHLTNLSSDGTDASTISFVFDRGEHGFVADFADFPPADREEYDLASDYRALPPPFESQSALFIGGDNHSDDLFMFFKGQVGGLVPDARYAVSVGVEIATDVPAGCVGIGGAPGESVYVKAGASQAEPVPVLEGNYLRMNIDIGRQSNGGENAAVLGDVANSRQCEESREWELKSLPIQSIPAPITASSSGRTWVLFGVDSGFEGRTEIYLTRATVSLAPSEGDAAVVE
ncbi:MAG: hypothetical protein F4029_11065 [Gammaproteobacteria bacterium]|nr:hypothetical protein [Gammaproteobacteria bacterium]MYF30377.1 hypothetical protein [Gammaproteobacteria bacterium]MYK46753.1 hypothetical protein [Gammaproteobacteria bacterium]